MTRQRRIVWGYPFAFLLCPSKLCAQFTRHNLPFVRSAHYQLNLHTHALDQRFFLYNTYTCLSTVTIRQSILILPYSTHLCLLLLTSTSYYSFIFISTHSYLLLLTFKRLQLPMHTPAYHCLSLLTSTSYCSLLLLIALCYYTLSRHSYLCFLLLLVNY